MFKPRKQISHHKPHSHNNPHSSQSGIFHKHTARQHPYGHGYHVHKDHSFNGELHKPDFHEHEACQNCPYKRGFYEHFHHEQAENSFHGHHHGSHHEQAERSGGAKQLEDGSLQCLCCPNGCIMTLSENGSVQGNHCPKGAEAAQHIAE